MVFAAGARPDAGQVAEYAARAGGFALSHETVSEGWLELIADGLTFDLTGLAPGEPAAAPPAHNAYGLALPGDFSPFESLSLVAGPHIAAAAAALPVVRGLAGLGATLAGLPGVVAVAWHPARSWCEPGYFRTAVTQWLAGGAFPGLGLAALASTHPQGMVSEGLALFAGRELRLAPALAGDRAVAAKLAVRLMHELVEAGGLAAPQLVTGPEGEALQLGLSSDGRWIEVSPAQV